MENFEAKAIQPDKPTNKSEELPNKENISEQIQSFINELPKNEGFIDFRQLQKIGQGGTHDVFVYTKNETFVIKLNRSILEKAISTRQSDLSLEMKEKADKYIEGENNNNEQLYKHFGREHCLQEKILIQKICIEKDGILQNTEGIISIQESSDIFKNNNKKDFSTGYAEQDQSIEKNKEIYNRMNESLLGGNEFKENDFLEFNKKIKPIFDLSDKDKLFRDSVTEFLFKFKNYFKETGNFIDVVGQENVLFYQQEGKWKFKLGSVIKGENKKFMEKIMEALENNPEIFNQSEEMKNQLINQLAFIRLINATGLKVGIGKIIEIKLTEKQLENLARIKFK